MKSVADRFSVTWYQLKSIETMKFLVGEDFTTSAAISSNQSSSINRFLHFLSNMCKDRIKGCYRDILYKDKEIVCTSIEGKDMVDKVHIRNKVTSCE